MGVPDCAGGLEKGKRRKQVVQPVIDEGHVVAEAESQPRRRQ